MRLGTLRRNDGYIYNAFVRNGGVLHGSLVQFDIIMQFYGLHGLRVSVRPFVVDCRDDIRVKRTIVADSID